MGQRKQILYFTNRWLLTMCTMFLVSPSFTRCDSFYNNKEKRQIYREQVLPFKGGKIPESALRTDRLNLNQLQREGFSLPDGVILYNRRHLRHPSPYHQEPELLKVYMTDDGRYVSMYGKYTTDTPDTIDTTYLIRSPIHLNDHPEFSNKISEFPNQRVFKPSLLSLIIPSSAIYGKPLKVSNQIDSQDYDYSDNVRNIEDVNRKILTHRQPSYNSKRHFNRNNYQRNRTFNSAERKFGLRQSSFATTSQMKISNQREDCSGCVHKTTYDNPNSSVWIKRYY